MLVMGDRVEPRREQRPARQRLPGVEAVIRVPPDPARAARCRIPAGDADEVLRDLRVREPARVARDLVGVEEGETPPAIVVEPCGLAGTRLVRPVAEAGHRLEILV